MVYNPLWGGNIFRSRGRSFGPWWGAEDPGQETGAGGPFCPYALCPPAAGAEARGRGWGGLPRECVLSVCARNISTGLSYMGSDVFVCLSFLDVWTNSSSFRPPSLCVCVYTAKLFKYCSVHFFFLLLGVTDAWGSTESYVSFPQEKRAYTAHIFIDEFKWIGYPEILGPQ